MHELRRTGLAWRWVDELDIPVSAWRAGIRAAARHEHIPIRTFLALHPANAQWAGSDATQAVYAIRTDRAPVRPPTPPGWLTWSQVDELDIPVENWRVLIRRVGRRNGVRIRTFLITPPGSRTEAQQVIYTFTTTASPEPAPAPTRNRLRLINPGIVPDGTPDRWP